MPRGLREPAEVRFWRYVNKIEGCWLWTGCKTEGGYGRIGIGKSGLMEPAHRLSYRMFNGPIPEGAWVLHKCDVRACVNPEHLYLGDRAQNMRDAHERGRIDLSKVASAPRPGARKASRY